MKLLFERNSGVSQSYIPACDVERTALPKTHLREKTLRLPRLAEVELARHYTQLSKRAFGVNCGFYPLGSCTMKYNPAHNEKVSSLPGFVRIHPLQPKKTVKGCEEAIKRIESLLCEVTGMDAMTMQPAAGAHGEFQGLLLIKKYFEVRGETNRTKIIVPDSAHGTNPASAVMAGFEVVNIASAPDGCIDLDALKNAIDENTAGLMLTNPNTVGIFDPNVLEITRLIHEGGGLCYYDGANLNAIMGHVRPGDMGFDVVHLNLHKTFSTPHGGGGPGAGPVGCKAMLKDFLPYSALGEKKPHKNSMGQVRSFYGNFGVMLRALAYILTLGGNGMREASETAVLNANYLMHRIKEFFPVAFDRICMHECIFTLEETKKETGVSALDVAKALLDHGMHPPTMYFPLIVHEALMLEPTETETKETLDAAADVFGKIKQQIETQPEQLHLCPVTTPVGRPDEVAAARAPVLRYDYE